MSEIGETGKRPLWITTQEIPNQEFLVKCGSNEAIVVFRR